MTGVFRHRYRFVPAYERGLAALSVPPKNATYSGDLTETVDWTGTLAKTVPVDGAVLETADWSGVSVKQIAVDGAISEALEWAGGGEKIGLLASSLTETLTWDGTFDLERAPSLSLSETLTWDGVWDATRAVTGSISETVGWTGNYGVPGSDPIPEVVGSEFEISLGSGSVTVAVPAGTVDGDILIGLWNGDGTGVVPAGWHPGPQMQGNFVVTCCWYWRVADSEPADYTFTSTGSPTYCVGAILTLEGVGPDPFEIERAYATNSSATRTNPGVQTSKDNSLVLLYTDGGNAYTMPSGWELATGNSATNIAMRLEPDAGTQTTFSATMPGGSSGWETFAVGIRAGAVAASYETPAVVSEEWAVNGSSIAVDVPSGVVDGDVLIAYANSDQPLDEVSGWNRAHVYNPTGPDMAWYWRIADSEPANYTFSATGGGYVLAGIMKVTGVDPTAPFTGSAAGAVGENPSGGRLNPGVYAFHENVMLLCYSDGTSNTTDPSGWTKVSGAPGSNVIAKLAGAEGDSGALEIAQVTNGFYFTHMVGLRPKAVSSGSETINYTGSLGETIEWAGAWAGQRMIAGSITETVGWTGAFDLARAASGALTEAVDWSGGFLTARAGSATLSETAGWTGVSEKAIAVGLSLTDTAGWTGVYAKIADQTLSLSYTAIWGSFYGKIGGALCTLDETAAWTGSGEAARQAGLNLSETVALVTGDVFRSAFYSGDLTETVTWVGDYGQPDAPSRTLSLTETVAWDGAFIVIRMATLDLPEMVSEQLLYDTLRLRTTSLAEGAAWDGVVAKSTPVTLTVEETSAWLGTGAKIGAAPGSLSEACVWEGGGYATRGGVLALSDTAALYPGFIIEHHAGGRTINLTSLFSYNLDVDSDFEYDLVVKVTIDGRPGLSYLIGRPSMILIKGAPWKNKDEL